MNLIYVHGMPASGKDTQAQKIKDGLPNSDLIVPGEIFRNANDPKNKYHPYYDLVAPYQDIVNKGDIVPEEVTMQLVAELIDVRNRAGITNFVFTGFPRTKKQLELLDDYIKSVKEGHGWREPIREEHIAYIVRESDAIKRAENRNNNDTQQREDDALSIVKHRLEVYKGRTYPMLEKLAKEGRLTVIRGDRSIEHVREITEQKLETFTGTPERR